MGNLDFRYAIIPGKFCGRQCLSERYPDKYLIGLTGNIAVGKSVVRRMLSGLGAATIDADQVAHQVILRGTATYEMIIAEFGEGILDDDREIDRRALGMIVFADPARLRTLESLTHPAVRRRIDQQIRDAEQRVVVIEAIKLLEGPLKNNVDAVWVVDASAESQKLRLINQRGYSDADAIQRIQTQNKQADKLGQADVIIENDMDIDETRAQVLGHWAALNV